MQGFFEKVKQVSNHCASSIRSAVESVDDFITDTTKESKQALNQRYDELLLQLDGMGKCVRFDYYQFGFISNEDLAAINFLKGYIDGWQRGHIASHHGPVVKDLLLTTEQKPHPESVYNTKLPKFWRATGFSSAPDEPAKYNFNLQEFVDSLVEKIGEDNINKNGRLMAYIHVLAERHELHLPVSLMGSEACGSDSSCGSYDF
jgi:hypothetical protein